MLQSKTWLFLPLVAICAVALATAGTAAATPKAAADEPPPFTFDWPVPGEAAIVEKVLKKGRTLTLRYKLTVRPADAGAEIAITDMAFVQIEGLDLSSGPGKAAAERALPMMAAIPRFRVDRAGDLTAVVGVPEMIDALATTMRLDPATVAAMKSPQMVAQLEGSVSGYWSSWAGIWVGVQMRPGEVIQGAVPTPLPFAQTDLVQPVTFRHLGPATECSGCVRLRFENAVEGAPLIQAMKDVLRAMALSLGRPPETPLDTVFETVSRSEVIETVTASRTLQPRWVRREKLIRIQPKGAALVEDREMRESTFEWLGR